MTERLYDWLAHQGLGETAQVWVAFGVKAVALAILATLVNLVAKQIVLRIVRRVIERTKFQWDDVYLRRGVFERLSHLAPAFVIHRLGPELFAETPEIAEALVSGALIYMAVVGIWVVTGFLDATAEVYEQRQTKRFIPLRAFTQLIKLILFLMGGILVLSLLLGKSPLVFFSGLGAFTAVLLLIFKDSILGLVAGIQISANDMVARGDWIEMPKYGADGDVIDVSLTTVKVQNWDKTISTIPSYALVSDSFRNWRGMSESGGRRIKRAIHLDLRSVRFCDEDMLERFQRIGILKEYLDRKLNEVREYNQAQDADTSLPVNGRHLTNLGTFRAYIEAYLRTNPKIHKDMTFLVRQLAPSDRGVPLEIYVFSNDQAWANYEAIQADIFDHLLAAVPMFDLAVYQSPSGEDLARLSARD